ncbi:MAG TPA: ABC transporter permease [Phycisphaerae bacterium]|nr:ABC transporter permease [Phycisphaerae bacterium]
MLSYILRRIVLMVPTLIGMTLLLFVLVRMAPGLTTGGGETGEMAKQAREAMEQRMKERLHLDKPLPEQYGLWLWDSVRGNLGTSIQYNESVWALIKERAPVTIVMNLISTFIVYLIAIPGGMLASVRRGKTFDVVWSFVTLALFSLPIIWVGDLLLAYLGNTHYLGWFPVAGSHATNTEWMTSVEYACDFLWHMVLPVTALTLGGFAYLSKLQRAAILDNLGLDYVRTARAKGNSGRVVMLRHVFRNSLLPMITASAGIIPSLLGGSVVVERIFSIKGMGDLLVTATTARDLPIVQGVALIGGVISLICLLITDIAYALADPRVSYE